MKSKDFVRSIYPQARAVRVVNGKIKGLQKIHWVVYESLEHGGNIGSGCTEAKAWKDAKDYILVKNQNKTPL